MKNADLPAMPLSGDAYEDIGGSSYVQGCYEAGMGLTKREYFAAMAMQGYASAGSTGMPPAGEIARLAVVTADALLEELEKDIDLLKKDC